MCNSELIRAAHEILTVSRKESARLWYPQTRKYSTYESDFVDIHVLHDSTLVSSASSKPVKRSCIR